MGRPLTRFIRALGIVVTATASLAGPLLADQFEDAQREAQHNVASPGGREYDPKLLAAFDEKHGKALAECASTVAEVDLDPFIAVLELGGDGHVKQVLLRPANGAAVCLRWSLRGSTFPRPPKAGFWMIAVDPRTRKAGPAPAPAADGTTDSPTPGAMATPAVLTTTPASGVAATTPAPSVAATTPAPNAPTPAPNVAAPTAPPPMAPTPLPLRPMPAPPPPGPSSGSVLDVRLARLTTGGDGDDALQRKDVLEESQRSRVERGLVAGAGVSSLARLDAWRQWGRDRFVPALAIHGSAAASAADLAAVRQARRDGHVAALEILAQSEGVAADDPRLDPWWSLAEELDMPVSIALGPPSRVSPDPRYRVALGDPLRLEPVLVRHPRLRVDVAQAAWPFADSMAAILRAYPQVFVDTGQIAWALDRRELDAYLKRLVDAGFAERILFASDASEPGQLARAIEAIESAAYLTPTQKRAILHDNAARWLATPPAAR